MVYWFRERAFKTCGLCGGFGQRGREMVQRAIKMSEDREVIKEIVGGQKGEKNVGSIQKGSILFI